MLIVAGSFVVAPEDRDAFLRSREAAMRTSRSEAGCIEYVFAADPLDATRVVLFERWEDKAALAAHLAAMRASRASSSPDLPSPPPVKVVSSEVVQYEISTSGAVGS